MRFRDLLETMNSKYNIVKIEKKDVDFYYLENINNEQYRVFIENNNNDLHIGFEWFDGTDWDISSRTNKLTAKEVFGIFGTIKHILKTEYKQIKSIFVFTLDSKKAQTYHNAIRKLALDFNLNSVVRDEVRILARNTNYNYKTKFKYKFNKE